MKKRIIKEMFCKVHLKDRNLQVRLYFDSWILHSMDKLRSVFTFQSLKQKFKGEREKSKVIPKTV